MIRGIRFNDREQATVHTLEQANTHVLACKCIDIEESDDGGGGTCDHLLHCCESDKCCCRWQVGDGGERAGGASAGRDKETARLKARIEQKTKELRQKEGHLHDLVSLFCKPHCLRAICRTRASYKALK